MNAVRSRKNKAAYKKYLEELGPDAGCQFCVIQKGNKEYIDESHHFKIVQNRFPYAKWDTQPVAEHLMIIPKQHATALKDLSFEACKEYVELISEYEHEGFNIYARAPGSKMKSVIHQHTHLIKLKPQEKTKTFLILPKPSFKFAR